VIEDSSTKGNDGRFGGITPAITGETLALDGSGDYLVTPNLASTFASETSTFEVWFYPKAAGVIVSEHGLSDPFTGWRDSQLEILSTGEVIARVWGLTPISLGTVSFNQWHHAAVRYVKAAGVPSVLSGFVDGVKAAATSTGDRYAPWEAGYGMYYALGIYNSLENLGSGAYFDGNVAEFRVWNVGRSDGDIKNNMNQRLVGNESGLVAYYRLDDVSGTSAPDSSVYNRDATLSGNAQSGSVGGPDRVPAPVHLAVSDVDFDPLYYSVSSDDPNVRVAMDGTSVVIHPYPWFSGTAHITVTAGDGPNAPHDGHGRTDVTGFDFTSGANAAYGRVWDDRNGDGLLGGLEPALDGAKLFVDVNENGVLNEGDIMTYSDANGRFAFGDLPFVPPVPYLPAMVVANASTTPSGGALQTEVTEPFEKQTITAEFANLAFQVRQKSGQTWEFSIQLPGEFTRGNTTVKELVDQLNALMLQQTDNVQVVQAAQDKSTKALAFSVVDTAGRFSESLALRAETERAVTERVYINVKPRSRVVLDEFRRGALGFDNVLAPGDPDAVIVGSSPITPDGGLVFADETSSTDVLKTTRTTATLRVSLDGGPLQTLTLTPELTAGNASLQELAGDLDGLLAGVDLGSAVEAVVQGTRLALMTTGLGSDTSLDVTTSTATSITRKIFWGDGTTTNVSGGMTSGTGALGFDALQEGRGRDKSYIVVQIPFPGWAPTTGTLDTADGPVGRAVVGFATPGAIERDVLFSNVLVADIELGEDLEVQEGDLVEIVPDITDPLGRLDDPFVYRWTVVSDNGDVVPDSEEKVLTFAPRDNGEYRVRLSVTDIESGLTAYPAELIVRSVNSAPSMSAGEEETADEGAVVTIGVGFTDAGILDTHTATLDWGDGTVVEAGVVTESMGSGTVSGSHVYADDGVHTLTVTVTDDDGAVGTDTLSVNVANVPPVVTISGADKAYTDVPYELSLSSSDPGEDAIQRWTIDWGDGPEPEVIVGNPSSVEHLYTAPLAFPADFDADGDIDGLDALRFVLQYREGNGGDLGDLDQDNDVDGDDLGVFASQFGRIAWDAYQVTATAADEDGTYTSNTLPVVDPPPPDTVSASPHFERGTTFFHDAGFGRALGQWQARTSIFEGYGWAWRWDERNESKPFGYKPRSSGSTGSLIDLHGDWEDESLFGGKRVKKSKRDARASWVEAFVSEVDKLNASESPNRDIRIVLPKGNEPEEL
jgi:hypothetical protein